MLYQEFTPHPCLRPYVEKFWTLETDSSDTYSMEHIITPNGAEGLILSYQEPAQAFILNGKRIALPKAYLLIQPYAPWTVVTEGCSGIVGVFFKASSLHTLLKTTMTEVVGQVIEPQAFLGSKPIRCLLEQLADAQPQLRIALVEKFFISCLGPVPIRLTTAQYAVNLIQQQSGMGSIEQIANGLGISRRAIDKQFAEKVGISPKYYSRMVRFSAVQRYLMHYPQTWQQVRDLYKENRMIIPYINKL